MKTYLCLLMTAVGLSVGTLLAQGFNARTGAWQFTITMKGPMPMGVPPEVRAQLEAHLAKPQISNSCVTAEDLKQLKLGKTDDSDDEDCKVLTSKITATSADITRQCTGDQAYTETAHFEAPTPQSLTALISRKTAEGTMTMTMTGKWIAAQCKE